MVALFAVPACVGQSLPWRLSMLARAAVVLLTPGVERCGRALAAFLVEAMDPLGVLSAQAAT